MRGLRDKHCDYHRGRVNVDKTKKRECLIPRSRELRTPVVKVLTLQEESVARPDAWPIISRKRERVQRFDQISRPVYGLQESCDARYEEPGSHSATRKHSEEHELN